MGNLYDGGSMVVAEDDKYTKDGTTDYRNNPAIKQETGTWKACPYILGILSPSGTGNECCERLAYYGINTNLMNESNVVAVNNVTNWSGTCYVTPLLGAFLADAYLGRYWTIATFSTIYVFGMTILTLSASVHGLKPFCDPNNGCHPTGLQIGVFYAGLYLIALGTGGIKPCVSSFGADQFDDSDEVEKKNKSSFFNWFYFSINIGALVASTVLVWIQTNVGWGWGFGIPAVAMAIAVVSFFSGTRLYRNQRPGGSPFTRICQVVVASVRKIGVDAPKDKSALYETAEEESAVKGSRKLEHTKKLSFFDKAAVETESDARNGSVDPWRLCTVTQVEELKSIIRLLPIWATGIIFSTVYSQMGTLFVLQGNTMDLHLIKSFEIPSASLSLFDTISVIFWVPVYDQIIVPFARKFTGNKNGFTQLQRIAIGLVISIFAMLVAGTLEMIRLNIVKEHNYYELKHMPLSIFWQVPQYFIIGCAEVFTFIGQLEFFYEQAPDAMRSLCSALSLTTAALGNYLSTLLVNIVTDISTRDGGPGWIPDNLNYGKLHYFFWLLAVLSVMNLGVYLVVAKWYTYKKALGTSKKQERSSVKTLTVVSLGSFVCCEITFSLLHLSALVFGAPYTSLNWCFLARQTVTECCERLAYYGMSTNLVNYLKTQLGQGNVTATNNVTNWSGTCYITPLIGAFVADSYLGRFWTIAIFATIYVIGMALLTLSASVPGLKPECNQFDDNDEREKRKKSSFFNWFYLSINIGAMIAASVLVWIQMNVGWNWGFGVPAVSMAIAVAFFFLGSHLYRLQIPGGSPLTRIFQVLVASIRKYNVKVPTDKSLLYETADTESSIQGSRKLEHTDKFRCLDKAAVETGTYSSLKGVVNPWSLCTVTQVEELKSIIGLLPIWASGIVFSTVSSQMGTLFVLQGNTMDQQMGPNFKIPSASLSLFNTLSVIFWAPVYDQVIIPLARKYTRNERGFTQLQRMGIGLVIATFAMIVAGLLEVARLDYIRRNNYYDQPTIPMSIFWQVPQYFLVGCAEVFTNIGQLEFFYDQAPDAMRSLSSALALTTHAWVIT
ncbi:UNVERIFIED_CONTAM: protein NRT1/ PTR FAMILY 8.1 [Sesamum radiatum]|uniref:Protein NRT1/ PTR FAMILY 8.1 n=1 Tax=Sesamum radiatum TaxID=300843 RepID=A0AAW2R5B0_SESRA